MCVYIYIYVHGGMYFLDDKDIFRHIGVTRRQHYLHAFGHLWPLLAILQHTSRLNRFSLNISKDPVPNVPINLFSAWVASTTSVWPPWIHSIASGSAKVGFGLRVAASLLCSSFPIQLRKEADDGSNHVQSLCFIPSASYLYESRSTSRH